MLGWGGQAAAPIKMKGIELAGRPLYLDMQATTPLDPRVLDAMLPFLTEQFGNPHSRTHMYGWESEDAAEVARKQVRRSCQTCSRQLHTVAGAHECSARSCWMRMGELPTANVRLADILGASLNS